MRSDEDGNEGVRESVRRLLDQREANELRPFEQKASEARTSFIYQLSSLLHDASKNGDPIAGLLYLTMKYSGERCRPLALIDGEDADLLARAGSLGLNASATDEGIIRVLNGGLEFCPSSIHRDFSLSVRFPPLAYALEAFHEWQAAKSRLRGKL